MDLKSSLSRISVGPKNILAAGFVLTLLVGFGVSQGSNTYGIDIHDGNLRMHGNSINDAVLGTALSGGGNKITNLADPSNAQDAATQSWVNSNDDNTDASSECSGSKYLAGDGTCDSDQYSDSPSDVNLGNVQNEAQVAESGDTMTGSLKMSGNELDEVQDIFFNNANARIFAGNPTNDDNPDDDITLDAGNDVILQADANSGDYECYVDGSDGGSWNCDGTKNWLHDLGNGSEAVYTSQESPEVRAVYEGSTTVENGQVRVDLPDHFGITVSDERPDLTVQVTPYSLATVAATERSDSQITIEATKDVKVDYRVTGIREGYEDKDVVRPKEE